MSRDYVIHFEHNHLTNEYTIQTKMIKKNNGWSCINVKLSCMNKHTTIDKVLERSEISNTRRSAWYWVLVYKSKDMEWMCAWQL